jgi:hypothetical protein
MSDPARRHPRGRHPLLATALALALALPARAAHAEAQQPLAPDDAPALTGSERRWYGWQSLLVDGASVSLLAVDGALISMAARGDATFDAGATLLVLAPGVLGGFGYLLGGPVVHWAHGKVGTGFLSLGLRVVAPLAGLGVGALIPGVAGYDNTVGGLIGTGAGAGAAMVIDDTLLAHETTTPRASSRSAIRIAPTWDARQHGAGLKVIGTF